VTQLNPPDRWRRTGNLDIIIIVIIITLEKLFLHATGASCGTFAGGGFLEKLFHTIFLTD